MPTSPTLATDLDYQHLVDARFIELAALEGLAQLRRTGRVRDLRRGGSGEVAGRARGRRPTAASLPEFYVRVEHGEARSTPGARGTRRVRSRPAIPSC